MEVPSFHYEEYPGRGDGDTLFILLPGILAKGHEQLEGVAEAVLANESGQVIAVTYTGTGFNFEDGPAIFMEGLKEHLDGSLIEDFEVILVGASVGGLFAHHLARHIPNLRDVVMIDTPFGAETLSQLPKTGLVKPALKLASKAPNSIGNKVLDLMAQGPKDHNIVVPAGAGNPESYKQWVSEVAMSRLRGNSWRLWVNQLRAMLPDPPREVVDTNYTYVSCVGKENDVVVQPLARNKWAEILPTSATFLEIEGPHCGFLEQRPRWEDTFQHIASLGE